MTEALVAGCGNCPPSPRRTRIGGRIVLNLAIAHAAEFRALIGLEAADFQQPWYDTAWLNRPDVHGGEVCAAFVSGLMAPQSPEAAVQETLWCYKQGGPGVFQGDLHFYRVDGDLRGRTAAINTKLYPLFLLTGEYDSRAPRRTRSAPLQASRARRGGHARTGPLPDEREPGAVQALHPAGAGAHTGLTRRLAVSPAQSP